LDARIAAGRATPFVLLQKAGALAGIGRRHEAQQLLQSLGPLVRQLEDYRQLERDLLRTP
jgi:hypothetical protein